MVNTFVPNCPHLEKSKHLTLLETLLRIEKETKWLAILSLTSRAGLLRLA